MIISKREIPITTVTYMRKRDVSSFSVCKGGRFFFFSFCSVLGAVVIVFCPCFFFFVVVVFSILISICLSIYCYSLQFSLTHTQYSLFIKAYSISHTYIRTGTDRHQSIIFLIESSSISSLRRRIAATTMRITTTTTKVKAKGKELQYHWGNQRWSIV